MVLRKSVNFRHDEPRHPVGMKGRHGFSPARNARHEDLHCNLPPAEGFADLPHRSGSGKNAPGIRPLDAIES